jgi:RNA polymerase sigma factor (sigma-70 family)
MLRSAGGLVRDVGRLLRDGVDPAGGDARLLHRFVIDRDAAAFEAIVDRHGPPVLAVCRRYLKDPADVEDAFQATFLVLVRKASGLRDGDALSSWLYGVAYRVAVRARSDALKRRAREGGPEGLQDAPAGPSRPADDAPEILDGELARLPDKYRTPLVLCYLEGRTHDQAAAELGWPVGTVRSRMAKGRSLLRERLARRGVDAPACLAAVRAQVASIPTVPSSLVAATASAAVRFAGLPAGLAWLGASPSSSTWPAARLALGVIATMSTTPWKLIGLTFAWAGLTAGAFAAGSIQGPAGQDDPPTPQAPPAVEKAEAKPEAKGVEARLAEVERKLDRMMELLESLSTSPTSPADPSSGRPTTYGRGGIGPAPATPPASEARTLREIEVQLVGLERKYRIVDRYFGVQSDRIPRLQAEGLREDAVAPARLLVARLRDMEAAYRGQLAQSAVGYGLSHAAFEDPVAFKAEAERAYREAGERLKRAEEAVKALQADPDRRSDPNDPAVRQARQEHTEARERLSTLARFLGQAGPSSRDNLLRSSGRMPSVIETLEPTYAKLAEIRRLIAWAKERFPDVEPTTEDAPAATGGRVE